MFDISFGELLVCAIVALLVLGPERLPSAARTVGRWVGRARHTVNHFTEQIDREIRADQLKRRIEEEIRKSGGDDIARQMKEALHAPLNIPERHETPPENVATENRIAPPAADDATAATPPATSPASPAEKSPDERA